AMLDQSRAIGVFGHGFTYSAHPVAAAGANETLKIYEGRNILGHVRQMKPAFLKRLRPLQAHPAISGADGRGLVGAGGVRADKATKKNFPAEKMVAAACARFAEEEGLLVRALLGDRIAFCPPLVISEAEIGEMFDRFGRALDKTEAWVRKEGLRG